MRVQDQIIVTRVSVIRTGGVVRVSYEGIYTKKKSSIGRRFCFLFSLAPAPPSSLREGLNRDNAGRCDETYCTLKDQVYYMCITRSLENWPCHSLVPAGGVRASRWSPTPLPPSRRFPQVSQPGRFFIYIYSSSSEPTLRAIRRAGRNIKKQKGEESRVRVAIRSLAYGMTLIATVGSSPPIISRTSALPDI